MITSKPMKTSKWEVDQPKRDLAGRIAEREVDLGMAAKTLIPSKVTQTSMLNDIHKQYHDLGVVRHADCYLCANPELP